METKFYQLQKKIAGYNEALSVLYWDLRTGAPKKGVEQRSEVIGLLSAEVYKLSTSDEMKELLDELSEKEDISPITKAAVAECKKVYEKNKKIPAKEYEAYVVLQAKAENVWEQAKEEADFSAFAPYLEKLVEANKRFISYWGYEGNKYNTLLDDYEPGMTVDMLDPVFAKLRQAIVPLVEEIHNAPNKPETAFLYKQFPKEAQRQFILELLPELGYDFEAGRLDTTVHPFAIGLNRGDVRITTKYDEHDFRMSVFGTIHECGHAIYEQNIDERLAGTLLCEGTSMGIHESQSLFYENFIGRNFRFWERHYGTLKKYAKGQFDNVSLEEFYRAINESKRSLIRIEADELTYPLHIMLRYEIEKALFNDEIRIKELPHIWNEKMEQYLGVRPENDSEGVLQDVHWAGGSFGYFPSYALGYMYAAQFQQKMEKEIPAFHQLIGEGNITPIKEWLTEHIHRFGKMKKPLDIIKDATGEELNVDYLIQYLTKKYTDVYQLR